MFARGVASRLGWPFVELYLSRMAMAEGGLPAGLGAAFAQLDDLQHVVVFIDEVEEIASQRDLSAGSVAVVNELLKVLVTFRRREGRLFVCATDSVRTLDSAFLRHGRSTTCCRLGLPTTTHAAPCGSGASSTWPKTRSPSTTWSGLRPAPPCRHRARRPPRRATDVRGDR